MWTVGQDWQVGKEKGARSTRIVLVSFLVAFRALIDWFKFLSSSLHRLFIPITRLFPYQIDYCKLSCLGGERLRIRAVETTTARRFGCTSPSLWSKISITSHGGGSIELRQVDGLETYRKRDQARDYPVIYHRQILSYIMAMYCPRDSPQHTAFPCLQVNGFRSTSKLVGHYPLPPTLEMVLREDFRMDARLSAFLCCFRMATVTTCGIDWSRDGTNR